MHIEDDIFEESGAVFSHRKQEGFGWKSFQYIRQHLPSGKEQIVDIWVESHHAFLTLLDRWNHCNDFKYRTVY